MKPLTREWPDKAESDLATARREQAVRIQPNLDAVAFHAQQAADKFIKAVLCERDLPFPRSHDLLKIAPLIQPRLDALLQMQDDLESLSQSAIEARYPGYHTDAEVAANALTIADTIAKICRSALQ